MIWGSHPLSVEQLGADELSLLKCSGIHSDAAHTEEPGTCRAQGDLVFANSPRFPSPISLGRSLLSLPMILRAAASILAQPLNPSFQVQPSSGLGLLG